MATLSDPTKYELWIFQLLKAGETMKATGVETSISEKTVESTRCKSFRFQALGKGRTGDHYQILDTTTTSSGECHVTLLKSDFLVSSLCFDQTNLTCIMY